MRALVALIALSGCGLTAIEAPDDAELDPEQLALAELGHRLFFDRSLSGDGTLACADCHQPEHGGAEPRPTSVGIGGTVLRRNAPTVWSAALGARQFWDGRARSLEEQALIPLLAPDEMGGDEDDIITHLTAVYADDFVSAGLPQPSLEGLSLAIAAYERRLVAPGRVDAYLLGDRDALDATERAGLATFRAQCDFCHGGDGAGGDVLRVLGDEQPWPADRRADLGVGDLTGNPRDAMVFRVPSLRHAASTPPYFHDGSVETLEDAIELMGWHQQSVRFTDREVDELASFLRALDGVPRDRWRLPPAL